MPRKTVTETSALRLEQYVRLMRFVVHLLGSIT